MVNAKLLAVVLDFEFSRRQDLLKSEAFFYRPTGVVSPLQRANCAEKSSKNSTLTNLLRGREYKCHIHGLAGCAMLTGKGNDQTVQGTNDDAQISKLYVSSDPSPQNMWRQHVASPRAMNDAGLASNLDTSEMITCSTL